MEEVAHVFLGHKANRLAAITSDDQPGESPSGTHQSNRRMLARDYNQADEEAAYAIGAAALAPFGALRRLVLEGRNSREIARHFRVSRQLVEYRIKVTHLWPEYKRASATRSETV
jgi:hypothetical protein